MGWPGDVVSVVFRSVDVPVVRVEVRPRVRFPYLFRRCFVSSGSLSGFDVGVRVRVCFVSSGYLSGFGVGVRLREALV